MTTSWRFFDQDVFEVAAGQDADFAALRGQRLERGVDRSVLADAFDAVADGDGAAAAANLCPPGCQGTRQSVAVPAVEVDHGERDVVVMDAARRRLW